MRAFIALTIPDIVKDTLAKIEENLKNCNLKAKWVKPTNLHLTLKFLGNIEEEKVEELKEIVKEVGMRFSPLEVKLEGFGFFPSPKNPRVFFVSVDKEKDLKTIATYLEDKLESVGFPKENRFKAHITLARFKERKNIDCLLKKIKDLQIATNFILKDIVLFKSTLTSWGPIYEEIFKATFKT